MEAFLNLITVKLNTNRRKKDDDFRGAGDTNSNEEKQRVDAPSSIMEKPGDIYAKHNLPREVPTIIDIKKAIPAHCFQPIAWKSVYYMVKDFAIVALLYFLVELSWLYLPTVAQLVITPVFWIVQGVVFTGIFVVGHDGGHESFSNSHLLNDLCGNICHTFLFCPYFMWKLSHRNHHKHTSNLEKEEVFYPVRAADNDRLLSILPGFGLGVGWFTYLVEGYRPRAVYHYNPFDVLFQKHVTHCVVSVAFLAAWALTLGQYWKYFGLVSLVYHWVVPVLVFGSFIVIITFLHHTDVEVPWYSDNLWNYVRGQLSSVDRDYGWCHGIIHNIGTHQIHHLFPKIPHYHLEEATAAFRRAFPDLVRTNTERILPAFYRMFQKYVDQSIITEAVKIHVYK